ncbi:AAA family ATPase [Streptomyces sp. NPDC059070]|uniref:ATP-binding protein n=1 Tax=unclassified Streptomyces TaxID=2593676 RepID=UPI0034E27595
MRAVIPPQDTVFVGRGKELALLAPCVSAPGLVTLTGPGGVGKTRLAAHLTALLSGEDGPEEGESDEGVPHAADTPPMAPALLTASVGWASLWQLRDDRLLAATVADASGLSDHTTRRPVHALAQWIGGRRTLLVLDSCEHLIPSCADLVAELLIACPALTVLATSREPLGLPGEQVHAVEPLPPTTDALELFLDRAALAGAPLTRPADLAAATAVCRHLEGMPLALELAAAQLPQRPVSAMAAALEARLDLTAPDDGLPDGLSPGPAHQRALRTSIGWSHELCTPVERLLWARMSVFRAATGAVAVRAVCGGGPLDGPALGEALAGLCRKSVLTRTPAGTYRMLDTVREYGEMWLDELGERDRFADRHARYVLELAREADRAWYGPAQADTYRNLRHGHADVCAALDHLGTHEPSAALELAALVAFFWVCCGHLHQAGHYLTQSLEHADAPMAVHARARWALGVVRVLQGDHGAASGLARHSHACAHLSGDEDRLLDAVYLHGLVLLLQGRPQEAGDRCRQALDALGGSAGRRARCRLVVIFAQTGTGRLEEAARAARILRAECVGRGELWTRAYTDHQLALAAVLSGRPAEAVASARRMVAAKHHLGDVFGVALGLDLLCAGLAAQGRAEQAAQFSGTALACWRATGHPQRGTPELAEVRDSATRAARRRIGDHAYDRAFRAGAHAEPATAVRRILEGPLSGSG